MENCGCPPINVVTHTIGAERQPVVSPPAKYFCGDDQWFERIQSFSAAFNRVLIYSSNNSRSVDIEPKFNFDPSPRTGRPKISGAGERRCAFAGTQYQQRKSSLHNGQQSAKPSARRWLPGVWQILSIRRWRHVLNRRAARSNLPRRTGYAPIRPKSPFDNNQARLDGC